MAMDSKMRKMGFISSTEIKSQERLIMSISGLEKQGKTHFALTAPKPISMFSTDIGEEGVVDKFDGDIRILHLDRVDEDAATQAEAEWDRFKEAYYFSLRSKEIRTLVVDTATEIWETLRMARFGRLTQVMPYQYGPVNAEYRALIRDSYKFDKNLILVHKMKPKYINDKRTADYELSGFNDTRYLVQVVSEIYRDEDGEFTLWVRDCRHDPNLMDEELVGPMCNFEFLAGMVHGS